MLFERIYDEELAQASYFIGCQATGEAIVVDPRRDARAYVEKADQHGMRITAVTETHIHTDYLSGCVNWRRPPERGSTSPTKAMRTGSTSSRTRSYTMGIRSGSQHNAPGSAHSGTHPEHLSFLVTDGAVSDEPGFILTGDFVFVGDLGRRTSSTRPRTARTRDGPARSRCCQPA